jgi:hypothetical protein
VRKDVKITHSVQRPCTLQHVVRRGAPKTATGFIYFLAPTQDQDPIKIGFTKELRLRLLTYIGHSPVDLALLGLAEGTADVERHLHTLFKLDRLHGEWFRSSSELRSIVEAYRYHDGGEIPEIEVCASMSKLWGRQSTEETTVGSRRRAARGDRKILPWMAR